MSTVQSKKKRKKNGSMNKQKVFSKKKSVIF